MLATTLLLLRQQPLAMEEGDQGEGRHIIHHTLFLTHPTHPLRTILVVLILILVHHYLCKEGVVVVIQDNIYHMAFQDNCMGRCPAADLCLTLFLHPQPLIGLLLGAAGYTDHLHPLLPLRRQ